MSNDGELNFVNGDLNLDDEEEPTLEASIAMEGAEIDREVADFVDEAPIRHDVLPESDSEDELELGGIGGGVEAFSRGDGQLYKGQTFFTKQQFAEAVLNHALKETRNIKRTRYDKTNVAYRCEGSSCNWRVYCSVHGISDGWEITVMNDKHSCIPNGVCDMLKVPVIARLFKEKLREEPDYYMPMKIAELIKENWGFTASRPQCQAARNKALKWIEKEHDYQFQRVRDYVAEIRLSNPQSTVELQTLKSADGLDLFNRLYICIDALKTSWRDTCRPVIGVDGAFLKSKNKGQLLVAIGRDANNAIYPIAWAIVQVENTPNWQWFLQKLKDDLGLGNGESFVLVSDRQKGLLNAVDEELPHIEHRMCVRHIYNNLKNKHGNKKILKPLIWGLAWSYNETTYKQNLNRILVYDKAVYDDVIKAKPQTFCRAFYKYGSSCEDVHNNFTESWNATVVKVRERQLIPMLEIIARLAMVRISTRYLQAVEYPSVCTPYAIGILKKELLAATQCKVFPGNNMMSQVISESVSYQVCLGTRTCSCKKWDIRGIPCEHGYAVILKKKFEVDHFVSHWFRTDIWRRTYKEGIVPTRGSIFWPNDEGADVYIPFDPPQPGRKKKQKRKKGLTESPTKKKQKKRIMHCRVCGAANHNSRFHKQPPTPAARPSTARPSTAPLNASQPSQLTLEPSASQPSDSQASTNV